MNVEIVIIIFSDSLFKYTFLENLLTLKRSNSETVVTRLQLMLYRKQFQSSTDH